MIFPRRLGVLHWNAQSEHKHGLKVQNIKNKTFEIEKKVNKSGNHSLHRIIRLFISFPRGSGFRTQGHALKFVDVLAVHILAWGPCQGVQYFKKPDYTWDLINDKLIS